MEKWRYLLVARDWNTKEEAERYLPKIKKELGSKACQYEFRIVRGPAIWRGSVRKAWLPWKDKGKKAWRIQYRRKKAKKRKTERKRSKLIIRTYDLTRNFGDIVAVNRVNVEIQRGELFTFLGPNGAGKTTLIRLLACLIKPSDGAAMVGGYDIREKPFLIRKMVGVVTQEPCLYMDLTGEENIIFFGKLYGMSRRQLEEKKEDLLELVKLKGREKHLVGTYSGGMKQRLSIACALVHEPQIVFFDEPTAGLDPQTKRTIWEYMKTLQKRDVTVVLNTHYMEEADKLSDRVAIIDRGTIVAMDSPSQLKKAFGVSTLEDVFIGLTGKEMREI